MATTTPFLGCKISLISKSEIRYEGILYTIDPKESTIALAKVRSYGTEDRSAERQVPPREEIFEYIIFRAGDIKDLIVDDPPASIAPGLADPAIIQAHSTSTTSGATFPSSTFPQMTTNTSISANSGQRTSGPAFTGSNAINSLTTTLSSNFKSSKSDESRSANSTPTGGPQHSKSPTHEGTTQTTGVKATTNRDNKYEKKSIADNRPQQHNYNRRGGQQNYGNSSQHNRRGSGQQQHYRQNHTHSQPPQSLGNRYNPGSNYASNYGSNYGSNYRQYNNYGSGGRRPPMQSRPQTNRGSQNRAPNRPKETIKFEGEFDFDKAQQEFKELEEKMTQIKLEAISNSDKPKEEVMKVIEPNINEDLNTNGPQHDKEDSLSENEHFYNKGKSFFDHISCEALEREKGNVQRIDWKAERKLNSETFGVPLSYRRMSYGRGRGFSNNRGNQYRKPRGGGGFGSFGRGGGGDTRRYNGPPRTRNN